MPKNKKNRKGILYSTDPNFDYEYENFEQDTLPPAEQSLEVCIDKHRAGKIAVIIKSFIGSNDDLKMLGKLLKQKCGVGGSVKNSEIIIQGNVRGKVMEILEKEGYSYKRVGG
ncbi:MAG: translation initiation factor [Bacteroidota bacterium]|nr:translation initiation factor [Bacteroidota bacterium]